MSRHPRPPLTLREYERLFRTIHAVVSSEKSDPFRACLFFGIAGAYIMRSHHRLKAARPVVGVAGYNLRTPTNTVMAFGKAENNEFISTQDNFHCWTEVDGWIVDLTAPLFDEMASIKQMGAPIPPRMLQKPAVIDSITMERLKTPGAYIHVPDAELTTALITHFSEKPAHTDLVDICDQWYVRPPKKMPPTTGIADQHGEMREVRLSNIRLKGSW